MRKLIVTIEKGKDHYAAFVSEGLENHGITGTGLTRKAAFMDMIVALDELRAMYRENKESIPEELLNVHFVIRKISLPEIF